MAKKRRKQVPAKQPAQQPNQPESPLAQVTAAQFQAYSGPLPAPEDLQRYDEILPGGAERIFAAFERQSEHRQALEKAVTSANIRAQDRGPWLGFIVALVFFAGSIFLITNGYGVAGTILGTTDLVGLVGVFVYGKRDQRKEREQKMRMMHG
jgi:uncharacterized membrane protein